MYAVTGGCVSVVRASSWRRRWCVVLASVVRRVRRVIGARVVSGGGGGVRVCVCACVRVGGVRVCVCACVRVRVVRVCVCACVRVGVVRVGRERAEWRRARRQWLFDRAMPCLIRSARFGRFDR